MIIVVTTVPIKEKQRYVQDKVTQYCLAFSQLSPDTLMSSINYFYQFNPSAAGNYKFYLPTQ